MKERGMGSCLWFFEYFVEKKIERENNGGS